MMTPENSQQPEACENCAFETKEIKAYKMYRKSPVTQYKWLCDLCASTPAGNAYEYPEQFHNVPLFQTVCYIGNAIIQAIEQKQKP